MGSGFGDFGLGGAGSGGVGRGIAEAKEEGLHVHTLLAGKLEVCDGYCTVLRCNGEVRFAVTEDGPGLCVKVPAHFSEEDFELNRFFASLRMTGGVRMTIVILRSVSDEGSINKLREGTRVGGEATDEVVDVLSGVVPIYVLELTGDLGGGLKKL